MIKSRGRPPHQDILTPAEWRTVHAVRHGLSNRRIAELQGISLDGVKFHVANAIAKLGLSNRKDLKFWSGAPVDSVLNSGDRNMAEDFLITGLGQVARSVKDIEQSTAWYRDVLELPLLYSFDKLAFFDCGGTRLMLSQGEQVQATESILYLRVADIMASHERLKDREVDFISAPHMIHRHEDGSEEWMAFFKDPEGRPLAIMALA